MYVLHNNQHVQITTSIYGERSSIGELSETYAINCLWIFKWKELYNMPSGLPGNGEILYTDFYYINISMGERPQLPFFVIEIM